MLDHAVLLGNYTNQAGDQFNIWADKEFQFEPIDNYCLRLEINSHDRHELDWTAKICLSSSIVSIWGLDTDEKIIDVLKNFGLRMVKLQLEQKQYVRFERGYTTNDHDIIKNHFKDTYQTLDRMLNDAINRVPANNAPSNINASIYDINNFRKEVLQKHYDQSNGSTLTSVLRPEIAKSLGVDNYNEQVLLDAILYLEKAGFLQFSSNVEDRLTVQGINEVEAGFPTLLPKKLDQPNSIPPIQLNNSHGNQFAFGDRSKNTQNDVTNKSEHHATAKTKWTDYTMQIVIGVVCGLIVAYLVYKFGWQTVSSSN